MSFYRFYPLQSAKNIDDVFKDDGIQYEENTTTIEDVLKQKFPKFPQECPSFRNIHQVYQNLIKLNTILGMNSLYPAQISSFNDYHEGFHWIEPSFSGLANAYQGYLKAAEQDKNSSIMSEAEFHESRDKIAKMHGGMIPYRFTKNMGVVSFCLAERDKKMSAEYSKMWGHYANGSYGVCVEFKVHDELIMLINDPASSKITLGWYNTQPSPHFK